MVEKEELLFPKLRIMETCPIDFGECKKREEIENEFNPSQIFLDIPYSGYNKEYEKAIKKVIESYGLIPVLAETTAKAEGLFCNVCKTIQKSGYGVADISGYNPNVLFELGILSSLGKKYCILCKTDTKIPVDLSGLIINKYGDVEKIEKNVSRWIIDNIGDIGSKLATQKKKIDYFIVLVEEKNFEEIEDKIDDIREIEGIQSLSWEYNRVVKKLIDFLKDEDTNIRIKVTDILWQIGDTKAVDPLVEILKDEEINVRIKAAYALGKLGDGRAVKSLILRLRDINSDVRKSAAISLGRIGKSSVEPLIKCLKDKDRIVQNGAALAFKNIVDIKALELLINALNDENPFVRGCVIQSLANIGDPRAIEPLTTLLEDDNIPDFQYLITVGDRAKEAITKIKSAKNEKKKE